MKKDKLIIAAFVLFHVGSCYSKKTSKNIKSVQKVIVNNFNQSNNAVISNSNNVVVNQGVVVNNHVKSGLINLNTSYMSPLSYRIIELSSNVNWASDINEQGQVVGTCAFNSKNHMYIWHEKTGYIYKADLRGRWCLSGSFPPYINNQGVLSTKTINDNGDTYHVDKDKKLRKNDVVIEETLKWDNREDYILSVNNLGQTLGLIETDSGKNELIVWSEKENAVTYINRGSKFNLFPVGINDNGWAIAWFQEGNGDIHGILWTPKNGSLIIRDFRPSSINNNGIIAGSIAVDNRFDRRGALWINGQIVDVSTSMNLDSNPSTALIKIVEIISINDRGQMVGRGLVNNPFPGQIFSFITPINLK